MQTIIMIKGLPGSGKSTWAKQYCQNNPEFVRINKDDIRKQLGKKNEKEVLRIRDEKIEYALMAGNSVVSDDTNFNPIHEKRIRELADQILGAGNYDFIINDSFCQVAIHECIRRNALRPEDERVPEKAIVQMFRQYLEPQPKEWVADKTKRTAVLVDMDGNLSLFGNKNPYDRDFENDVINIPLLIIIRALYEKNVKIIFVSGRDSKFSSQTREFLARCGFTERIDNWGLYMRNQDDRRPDYIVKEEFADAILSLYNVLCVFDDRPQVKRMWVSKGLFVFDTNQYSLEF